MATFAKLNNENVVTEVIVVHDWDAPSEQGGVEFLTAWSEGHTNWKQTSYNGIVRKNYAGAGYTYDAILDAFIPPKPYPSWVFVESVCQWNAPIPMPEDGKLYSWDEQTISWKELT